LIGSVSQRAELCSFSRGGFAQGPVLIVLPRPESFRALARSHRHGSTPHTLTGRLVSPAGPTILP